jgi:acyl-homoserine-lactone acylase
MTHFKNTTVTLEALQQHRRQGVSLPVAGGRDVLAALYATKREDGRLVSVAGDSYVQLVRYSADTVEIETVNAYGASAKQGNTHAIDQMELYVNKKLKPMTLNKASIYANAESIYHPGN